ncbi:MAG TPA: cupredoxin domain-containing protein [Candidatus Binataceae bacterium]
MAVLGMLGLTTGLVTYGAPAPARTAETAQVVKITASKFHFTPDRVVLAKGQPVTLQLTSADRTHGFMVKAFGIDTDILPGKTTAITIRPEKVGTYTTICDHYCGLGHSGMKMTIVVEEAAAKSSPRTTLASASRAASK